MSGTYCCKADVSGSTLEKQALSRVFSWYCNGNVFWRQPSTNCLHPIVSHLSHTSVRHVKPTKRRPRQYARHKHLSKVQDAA